MEFKFNLKEYFKKDKLYIARQVCGVLLFALSFGCIAADLATGSKYYLSVGGLIAFFIAVFVWPNKANYCGKCGKKYTGETLKLLRTDKRFKETKKNTMIIYTHNISHTCKCECGNTYVYSLQEKGGYRTIGKDNKVEEDKSIPASHYINGGK